MKRLQEFLVYQLKDTGVLKTRTTSDIKAAETENRDVVHEWNNETMDKKLGPLRAKVIRALPADHERACKWIVCPFTGSDEDPMRLWLVPQHILINANKDTTLVNVSGATEADASDVNVPNPDDGGALPLGDIRVKIEEKSREELLSERGDEILKDPKPDIRKLNEYQLLQAEWSSKCNEDMFKQPLVTTIEKNKPELAKVLKTLLKIHKGETMKKGQGRHARARHSHGGPGETP